MSGRQVPATTDRAEPHGPLPASTPTAVVVMGVAGCGKSTVGRGVADRLGWVFADADDRHPRENVEKMRRGEPLEDDDRWPWLDALHDAIDDHLRRGESLVLACSALKHAYRSRLGVDGERVRLVHLDVDRAELERRLDERRGHFMGVDMLESQLAALERPWPAEALILDGSLPADELAELVVSAAIARRDDPPR